MKTVQLICNRNRKSLKLAFGRCMGGGNVRDYGWIFAPPHLSKARPGVEGHCRKILILVLRLFISRNRS